jgi:hypothetical protein
MVYRFDVEAHSRNVAEAGCVYVKYLNKVVGEIYLEVERRLKFQIVTGREPE